MMTVAALCGFGGLVLGLSSNVRMLILVVPLMACASFVAGVLPEGSGLTGLGWALTAMVTAQFGYISMIVFRAAWSVAQAKFRKAVPF
jgi:hypothetical protein